MSKYKIMFTIDTMGNGGAERVVSVLANQFVKEGYEVLITQLYSHKCDYELNDKIKLNCVSPKDASGVSRSIKTMYQLRKCIKIEKPDVIISFLANINIYTILASRGLGVPVIASERNDPSREPAKKYLRALRSICYLFVDCIVFQTKEAQMYFNRRIQVKGRIIFNPIVDGLPEPCTVQRNKNIVTVCRLSEQKNLKLLIDSFELFNKKYNGYQLIIYGEGEQRKELENYIEELEAKDRISLAGFVNDIHDRIKNSCMFILSSDYEGMPNALIEAMALGISCISTDCPIGGPREIIRQYENGVLVSVNGLNELLSAMSYLTDDLKRSDLIGKEAVLIRDKLSVDKIVIEWEKCIEMVTK